jgi:hypothetical protein
VWAAIEELTKRGHLLVKKGGGRAKANTYAMILLNGATHCTVSSPETVQVSARPPSLNGATHCTTTLRSKLNSREGSLSMSEDKQAEGSKPVVLKVHSEQWTAWMRHHEATGNQTRARWGEWAEPTEWPDARRESAPEKRRFAAKFNDLTEMEPFVPE